MGKHTISGDQTTSWNIDESGKTWTLTKDGSLSLSTTTGITENMLQHDNKIVVNGDITVTDFLHIIGYRAIELTGTSTDLIIGKSSKIVSDYGVTFASEDGRMTNNGIIDTVNQGVSMFMDNVRLTNSGSIDGYVAVLSSSDNARIVNTSTGELKGSTYAIAASGDGDIRIDNHGLIKSDNGAIAGGNGKTHIVNTGKIVGDVELGGGNDIFDTRGGEFNSTVKGGLGNDSYYVNKAGIQIDEDVMVSGTDTVKSSVSFSLEVSGREGIEKLTALGHGDIKLTGNDLANRLAGNDGDNRIAGGMGDDTVTGGKGADIFIFQTGFAQDTIKDFQDGTDRIDVSGWTGLENFQDIKQHMAVDGDNLVIALGTDELVLRHMSKAELNAGDFVFA